MWKNLKAFIRKGTGSCRECSRRSEISKTQVHCLTNKPRRSKGKNLKPIRKETEPEGVLAYFLVALSDSSVTGINSLASAKHP